MRSRLTPFWFDTFTFFASALLGGVWFASWPGSG
jgi:hypothetical protein